MKYIKFPYYYSRPNYALDRPRISDDPLSSELNDPRQSRGFTDPSEALELIRANPDRFDLVISDMAMPHMPGDVLIAQILALRPEIPTIICTGFSSRISAPEASELGVKAFLFKPVTKVELAKTIRKVLDEAKSQC